MKTIFLVFLINFFGLLSPAATNCPPSYSNTFKLEFLDQSVVYGEYAFRNFATSEFATEVKVENIDFVLSLNNLIFNEDNEIIGFDWEVNFTGSDMVVIKVANHIQAYQTGFLERTGTVSSNSGKGISHFEMCLEDFSTPTPTFTPTMTPTATDTPVPTSTPTMEQKNSSTATIMPTSSTTPTPTSTATMTPTPTETAIVIVIPTPEDTPTNLDEDGEPKRRKIFLPSIWNR